MKTFEQFKCMPLLVLWCGTKSMDDALAPTSSDSPSDSSSTDESENYNIKSSLSSQDLSEEIEPENTHPHDTTTIHSTPTINIHVPVATNNIKSSAPKPYSNNTKRIYRISHSVDASMVQNTKDHDDSTVYSSESENEHHQTKPLNNLTTLTLSQSMPDPCINTQKTKRMRKVFSEYLIMQSSRSSNASNEYTLPPLQSSPSTTEHTYNALSPHPKTFRIQISKPEEIATIFYQLTSLKKLDTVSEMNVILDEFLSDYYLYNSLPYKYLFRNDIIGHLLYAWDLGIQQRNATVITYAIKSLSKFMERTEFKRDFSKQRCIQLMDKTLCIPSLQRVASSDYSDISIQKLSTLATTYAVNTVLEHILAVLKIIRDVCRLHVIDTNLWYKSRIHKRILDTMKREFDKEEITKACRSTIMVLLSVSYEMGQQIIKDEQIHDMVHSFLEVTKNEYLMHSNYSLPRITDAMSLSIRSESALLAHPLFVYNCNESLNAYGTDGVVNKKQIKHEKKKNLLELEAEAKKKKVGSAKDVLKFQESYLMLRAVTDVESSEYVTVDTGEESEYETGDDEEETEYETEDTDDTDDTQSTPQIQEMDMDMEMENKSENIDISSLRSVVSIPLEIHDSASVETYICNDEQSEIVSILSLQDYDRMVEEANRNNHEMENDIQFTILSDDDDGKVEYYNKHIQRNGIIAEKPSWNDIAIHSVNIDEDDVVIDIALNNSQLLYINSLFQILYRIITLRKPVQNNTKTRPSSKSSADKHRSSFVEMLQRRKNRDRALSGETMGRLSHKDATHLSDSEMVYRKQDTQRNLKHINREKNKLLESFFASLSFKNLFKLLKYYRLSAMDDYDYLYDSHTVDETKVLENEESGYENGIKMMSIEKLACKILRKALSYSQIVTDKLLIDDELDVIGILVTLLFRNPSNIDLIIYILDIFSKISKDNEAIRDLLLSPEHFDKFLRALDPRWMLFIKSTQKMDMNLQRVEAKKQESFLHLRLMRSMERVMSVESIGIAEKQDEDEINIEVTIAMLKFFHLLCQTNAFDMIEYGINDRILVLLDYYVKISVKYDKYNTDDEDEYVADTNVNYTFIFSNPKHQQCLSLCLECIQHLATDINMLLEFVFSGTVEKLSMICWSFRDHSTMIKKCCAVINKLLKLEQACKQIANQNILQPLISTLHYIFKKNFMDNKMNPPTLLIASVLFPDVYTKVKSIEDDDEEEEDGSYDGEDDEYEYDDDDDDEKVQLIDSDTTDEELLQDLNRKTSIQQRLQFLKGETRYIGNGHRSMSPLSTNHHTTDLKDLFNVLVNMSYVDKLCIEIIESDLMLLLIECIANDTLLMHKQMMISLVVSDLMQHLTKNKKGAQALIRSKRFEIAKYIVNAIENNRNNRGVVSKYFKALINLKDANRALLKQQLIANKSMNALQNVSLQYRELINVDELIAADNKDDGDNANNNQE